MKESQSVNRHPSFMFSKDLSLTISCFGEEVTNEPEFADLPPVA
jgi:hypothetical protein